MLAHLNQTQFAHKHEACERFTKPRFLLKLLMHGGAWPDGGAGCAESAKRRQATQEQT